MQGWRRDAITSWTSLEMNAQQAQLAKVLCLWVKVFAPRQTEARDKRMAKKQDKPLPPTQWLTFGWKIKSSAMFFACPFVSWRKRDKYGLRIFLVAQETVWVCFACKLVQTSGERLITFLLAVCWSSDWAVLMRKFCHSPKVHCWFGRNIGVLNGWMDRPTDSHVGNQSWGLIRYGKV